MSDQEAVSDAGVEFDLMASLLADPTQFNDIVDIAPHLVGDQSVRTIYSVVYDKKGNIGDSALYAILAKEQSGRDALDEISYSVPDEHRLGTPEQIRQETVKFIYNEGRRLGPAIHYAEQVRDNATMRMIQQSVRNTRREQFKTGHEYAMSMANQLNGIAIKMAPNANPQSLSAGVDEAYQHFLWQADNKGLIQGIKIGLDDYDTAMGGLQPGEQICIGGHSGEGKTQLKAFMAIHAAITKRDDTGKPTNVAYFSLEMSPREMAGRWISNRAGVSIGERFPTTQQRAEIGRAAKELRELSDSGRLICVEPGQASTLDQIIRTMHKLKHEYDIGAVFIDYAQLIRVTGGGDSKYDQMASIAQRLKLATVQLGVSTLLGVQLNREALTSSAAGRPRLFHVADSMDLVRSADAVQFIWTPARHLHGNLGFWPGKAVLLTEKVRARPPINPLYYSFDPSTTSFEELNPETNRVLNSVDQQDLLKGSRYKTAKD